MCRGVRGGVPCAGCVCRECAGSVPGVCRVCAGVSVGGVWAVWPVLEQCAGYVLAVLGGNAHRASGVGCGGCVPGCAGQACWMCGVCPVCAGSVPDVCCESMHGSCCGCAGCAGVCRECAGRVRESMGRGCAGRVPGGVLGAWGVCHARHPARRLPECVGVPGARAGCGVRGGVPCAGCVCVPGVCRVCAGVLVGGVWAVWPVLEQCAGYVLVGRLVWGVVGVCRAVPAKRAGCVGCARCVPGVCQMCAARACMGRAAGVRGVCRECAGRVRESMGRGCAGRVPGGVLGALGVCHARHPARRLPERAGVPGARAGCGVRGGVPCAGCVPGCAGCVRCVRRGCVGCVACA